MNREKLAWSTAAVLLAVLAFEVPGTLAQRDDDYGFVRTLADVHRRVDDNYVDPVDDRKLNVGAIDGMLDQLDPFSNFVPPDKQEAFEQLLTGNFKGVGIRFDQRADGTFEIITPVDGSPAAASGIEAGDVLLAVDNRSLEGVARLDLPGLIGGPLGTSVTLTVRHPDGKQASYTLVRSEVHTPTVKGYRRRPDNTWDFTVCDHPMIGYVRLTQFTGSSYAEVRGALEPLLAAGAKGLILDLRFNPGGELEQAERIINMLVPKGRTILTTRGRARPEHRDVSDGQNGLADFPLIVLVNEHSASAAEIVSGSLMDNGRAVVLGERTYGKGSVQEVIPLDERGGELKLTVAYYYLPSGRLVHRRKDAADWGVQPQVTVPLDTAGQERVMRGWDAADLFRRRSAEPATAATRPSSAAPATQPTDDPQLQAAVNTMLGVLVFRADPATPATRPAR